MYDFIITRVQSDAQSFYYNIHLHFAAAQQSDTAGKRKVEI